jgi:hypothetical protein
MTRNVQLFIQDMLDYPSIRPVIEKMLEEMKHNNFLP